MFFLDTNTCVYFLNGRSANIRNRILGTAPIDIGIPVIVKAELILGAYKSKNPGSTLDKVERFLIPFTVIPFEDQMSYHYAEIRSQMEKAAQVIAPNDLLIAAITRFHEATLITNNEKKFRRVGKLGVENWF